MTSSGHAAVGRKCRTHVRFSEFLPFSGEVEVMAGGGFFGSLTGTVEAPGQWMVLVTGLFAAVVSAGTFAFLASEKDLLIGRANVLGTVFHEGGHALASVVTATGSRSPAPTAAPRGRGRRRRGRGP